MAKPPDISQNNLPHLKWDMTKTIHHPSNDPIYLLMTRVSDNENETLANTSPFLIKKAIDNACGEVEECKKTRSGQLLIKTKNNIQANKLVKLISLTNTIKIDITLHKTLNYAKGVIYCNDLREIPENEILQELKSQGICEVKKIMKKTNDILTETGLIIITFASSNTPLKINIGYQKIPVRPYIPPPMRCRKCWRYGHIMKYCTLPKSCPTCSNLFHTDEETNEKCTLSPKCSNCILHNITPSNHTAFDKTCPIFIKESELQAIKTTYKVDNAAAKQIYRERHQHNLTTYSTTLNNNKTVTKPQVQTNSINKTATQTNLPNSINKSTSQPIPSTSQTLSSISSITMDRSTHQIPKNYSDLQMFEDSEDETEATKTSKKVKVFPKNISKRLQAQLKKINNSQSTRSNATSNAHNYFISLSDKDSKDGSENMDYTTLE